MLRSMQRVCIPQPWQVAIAVCFSIFYGSLSWAEDRSPIRFSADGIFFASSQIARAAQGAKERRLKLSFLHANPDVQLYRQHPTQTASPPTSPSRQVLYPELWPGIDAIYNGEDGRLTYTFIVKPGADPTQMQLAYRGATKLVTKHSGRLVIISPDQTVEEEPPQVYQEQEDGKKIAIAATYVVDPQKRTSRIHPSGYDPSRPLLLHGTFRSLD